MRFDDIRDWGRNKGLCSINNMPKQMLKLTEEVGEIAGAIAKNNHPEIIDGIGDAVVVLTLLADQLGVTIEHCIEQAWLEIRDRQGKTVDGVFIKAPGGAK